MRRNTINRMIFLFLSAALLVSACQSAPSTQQDTPAQDSLAPQDDSSVALPLRDYWNDVDLRDTTYLKNPETGEQKLANYIAMLARANSEQRQMSLAALWKRAAAASPASLEQLQQLFGHYLYNPNSPMRNYSLYGEVLQSLIKASVLPASATAGFAPQLALIAKNKPGLKAEDFRFTDSKGKVQRLHNLQHTYTAIIFYDPECSHCQEVLELLRDNEQVVQLLEKQGVTVLTLYPWGDEAQWRAYHPSLSSSWVNGMASTADLIAKNSYDLRASPTLYLLNSNMEVLLQDVTIQELLLYIQQQIKAST